MPQACEAFTQKFRPCRAYADEDGLCSKHKYWYQNMKWFDFLEKHIEPYTSAAKLLWAKRVLRSKHATGNIDAIEARVLGLCDHMRTTTSARKRARLSQFYELLAETGRIRPLLIPSIWRKNVTAHIGIAVDNVIAGTREALVRDIVYRTIFKTWIAGDSVAVVISALLGLLVNFTETLDNDPAPIIRTYQYIIDCMDLNEIAYIDMDSRYEIVEKGIKDLFERVTPVDQEDRRTYDVLHEICAIIDNRRRELRDTLKADRLPLKEDIMAAAWHPDRMAAYLAQGVDLETL